jgi:biotin synthase-like enzyme
MYISSILKTDEVLYEWILDGDEFAARVSTALSASHKNTSNCCGV